jgi:hypothetical protein
LYSSDLVVLWVKWGRLSLGGYVVIDEEVMKWYYYGNVKRNRCNLALKPMLNRSIIAAKSMHNR